MEPIVVSTFYHFINLPHYESLKEPVLEFCNSQQLKGTILLANEGINSTISGKREAIDNLYQYLTNNLQIIDLVTKESLADFYPFMRMKVRLKREIVAMGYPDMDLENFHGEYIESKDWDEFISRDDVITIDTRNDYEVMLGTFKGAINPKTNYFREFPKWVKENKDILKDKKIAMCCTGGVRCEKSTAYLKQLGFTETYHLKGGILQYLEETKNKNGKWNGICFVFDDRVAVNDKLEPADDQLCTNCNDLFTPEELQSITVRPINSCPNCAS